jgi:DNA (cytosine-5)-methyltransferase 1
VDTASPITHVSLCAGYGGIDLGLHRCIPGLRTVAYAEIEAFAIECLLARMEGGQLDPAPLWTDLRTFPFGAFHNRVDILSGGYPCQPFSAAGKRLGADDPRHLWPAIARGIAAMRPRLCFFENVEGHITLGLRNVLQDLAGLGYRTTWGIFSASEVGAPHQRKRVFILAESKQQGSQRCASESMHAGRLQSAVGRGSNLVWPSCRGDKQHDWEPPRTFPPLGRSPHGPARGLDYAELCVSCDNRTDELRLLGNGVVPATAERAFRTLWEELQ